MKITAGLGALKHYEALADAGADELFAGYVPVDWLEKYQNFTPLNRREVLMQNIQLSTMDEMRLLARKIQNRGVPVSLTFNSICYRPEQYPIILEIISALLDLGFQNWIVADPALILHLKERGIPGCVHLSGEAGCFNPNALSFFKKLHISRVIFPRKMSIEEMGQCIQRFPDLEYEAFVLNERCHYSGAFCSSLHCDELEQLCRLPYLPWGPDCHPSQEERSDFHGFGASGCALCALKKLEQAGVTHLKVVGRGAHVQDITRDIAVLKKALNMSHTSPDYLRSTLLQGHCSHQCYYLDLTK